MLEINKTYKTRGGSDAHVVWKCNTIKEKLHVFYVILTEDEVESKPVAYFENGKRYAWSLLNFVETEFDIMV